MGGTREARMPMSPQSDRSSTTWETIQESALGAEEIHREVALQLVWRQLKLLEEAEQPHLVLLTT